MMNQQLEQAYFKRGEPIRSCLLALREIILGSSSEMTESLKYGMPFFSFKGKMFAYFWFDKKSKHPYIGFSKGYRMTHPGVLAGSRKRIKVYAIDPTVDIKIDELIEILEEAKSLYL